MVAVTMAVNSRESLGSLIDSVKSASDVPSKLDRLRRLKRDLPIEDLSSMSRFLPRLFELRSDRFASVRKLAAGIFGEIGSKHVELLPDIVTELITVLDDATPPVVRQCISCGIDLFSCTLEKVAIQGLYPSELNDSLASSWESMLRFKEKIYTLAFQPGGGGIRLLALKFVVAIILLYTPDPNGSTEPSSDEENLVEFNVSWLHGGHPILNVGDLSIEASKNLGVLLDQLRSPVGNSLSNSTTIVLINSLSAIAKKRPAFYGRIMPVLLGFNPSTSVINGIRISGAHHALRNAFLTCLNCTYPGAAPWRDRLIGALRKINDGGSSQEITPHNSKINGGERHVLEDTLIVKEEKLTVEAYDSSNNLSKKRSGSQDKGNLYKDDDTPGKRLKATPSVSEDSAKESDSTSKGEGDTGPVHQLVAMFGALVGQGEKAIGSLEILISSISADLLAELVLVNMHNLPPDLPMAGDDETLLDVNICDSQAKYPPSFVANVQSLHTTFPKISSLLAARPSVSSDTTKRKREVGLVADNDVISVAMDDETENPLLSTRLSASADVSSQMGFDESIKDSTSFGERSSLNLPTSVSTERSEDLSPKAPTSEANSLISSTATSVGLSNQLVLPKILAPVINLADDEKDNSQKSAFNRVIEAYKHVLISGGAQLRSSLLAQLVVEFPLELDPWNLIQKHILEDYINHEGHELTLRILYRLFGEAEVGRDFFSSTTATSVYEVFLLSLLETMRDSFPPSDKSLSRLLGEVPYLPSKVLSFLEGMCSHGDSDKTEKEVQSGDRVTQGLSTLWSLILLRPAFRDSCLKIVLKSAVHQMEEVRMKAIRLVANKLYPMTSIAQRIEEFAQESLLSVIIKDGAEKSDAEGLVRKDSGPETSVNSKDVSSDTQHSFTSQNALSFSLLEAQRCMALYFALCTKKNSLFREVFVLYKSVSPAVEQVIERHIPMLIRTMGTSSDLLDIISDPPVGSDSLLMQVLHILTDGAVPCQELIFAIKKLYASKLKNIEILIPIFPFLTKDEVLINFPQVLNLPGDKFQAALSRILQGSPHSGPLLAPAEVLIAIHGIDPEKDKIPLKQITDACNACFEQRQIFTQQVIAKVLNQLVEQIPLPVLFMRTVLQAIGAYPALADFSVEILSRLVNKQIWKYPKLWVGFLKCAFLTKPQSFSALLQLPPVQLENAMNRTPVLRAPLITHASQPDIRSTLPRSTLVILGINSDSQTSRPQTSQSQVLETTATSDIEVATERSKEFSGT